MTIDEKTQAVGIEQPAEFAIKIQGCAGESLAEWFGPLTVIQLGDKEPLITLLSGIVTDQAGLLGVIRRLHGLGIVLLSIERVVVAYGVEEDDCCEAL